MKKIFSILVACFLTAGIGFAKPIITITAGFADSIEHNLGGEVGVSVSLINSDLNKSNPGTLTGSLFTEANFVFLEDETKMASINLGYGLYNIIYANAEISAGINYTIGDKKPSVVFTWRVAKSIYNFGRVHLSIKNVLRNSKCENTMILGIQLPIVF